MSTMTKSMIGLAFAGAILVGNASPSLARDVHARAPAPDFGFVAPGYGRGNERGAYAQVPRGYGNGRTFQGNGYVPPAAVRPGLSWDPYGLRWDGAD